jgi:hypothetical protein
MLGMITTFLYAVASDRAISLTWEQPLPLDMIFDSPFVDWSNRFLPAPSPARHPIYDNQTLIDSRLRIEGHLLPSDNMKMVMTNLLEDQTVKDTPWVQVCLLLLASSLCTRSDELSGNSSTLSYASFLSLPFVVMLTEEDAERRPSDRNVQPPASSEPARRTGSHRTHCLRSTHAIPSSSETVDARLYSPVLVVLCASFDLLRRNPHSHW